MVVWIFFVNFVVEILMLNGQWSEVDELLIFVKIIKI